MDLYYSNNSKSIDEKVNNNIYETLVEHHKEDEKNYKPQVSIVYLNTDNSNYCRNMYM